MTRFLRHAARIVIGAVLVVAVYWAISTGATYQREQRIAAKIAALGGIVRMNTYGPEWVSPFIRGRIPLLDRVDIVVLTDRPVPADVLSEIASLSHLRELYVANKQLTDAGLVHVAGLENLSVLVLDLTQVTDAGMEHLKRLTTLKHLGFASTHVTDAGLAHLSGLTSLESIWLDCTEVSDAGLKQLTNLTNLYSVNLGRTQTTAEGRAMLRKALPNCKIDPDP